MRGTRVFTLLEAAAFISAALTHFGLLWAGYEHRQAGNAESVIGIVLFGGWILTWVRPSWTARVSVVVQTFALFGTLVGIFTIAVGVGPRSTPDLIYHACIVIVLISGLMVSVRTRRIEKAMFKER